MWGISQKERGPITISCVHITYISNGCRVQTKLACSICIGSPPFVWNGILGSAPSQMPLLLNGYPQCSKVSMAMRNIRTHHIRIDSSSARINYNQYICPLYSVYFMSITLLWALHKQDVYKQQKSQTYMRMRPFFLYHRTHTSHIIELCFPALGNCPCQEQEQPRLTAMIE